MRALLLAAGFGTRLQPLTNVLPKCLVPINGRPLLDYWIETLLEQGISEVLINTHYRADLVEEYIRNSRWQERVLLVYEERLLGTAGTALANRTFFQGESFLLVHADNLTRFNCKDFIDAHRKRPEAAAMTMMLFKAEDPRSCGVVDLGEDGIVLGFHEKVENPPSNLANAAVYLLEPEVMQFISTLRGSEIDFSTQVIPHFVGRIASFLNNLYHRDIGTINSWKAAQSDFGMPLAHPDNAFAWRRLLNSLGPDVDRLMADLLAN